MSSQATDAGAPGSGPMSLRLTERRAVLLWLVSRSAMFALSLGWHRDRRAWSDVGLYADWARTVFPGGEPERPLDEYPPLTKLLLLCIGWAPSPVLYVAIFIAAMAAIDLLFLRVVLNAGADTAPNAAVILWIVAPALLGGLIWTRFDLLPAVAAAMALSARSSSLRRGAWLGIAIALKLWPVVLLPSVLMLAHRPRRALVAALSCLMAAVVVPSLVVAGDPWGAVTWTLDRGLHLESVPGSLVALTAVAGAQVSTVFAFGAWEVEALGTGTVEMIFGILGVGFGVCVLVLLRRLPRTERDFGARVAGIALVAGLLIFSKVLSPQYILWIIPLAAILLAVSPPRRPGWLVVLVLGTCATTHLVYPLLFDELIHLQPVGVAVLLLRNVMLTALAALMLLELRSAAGPGSMARHRQ